METKMILVVNEGEYDLILSDDPCDVFEHYGVEEMHGLNLTDCRAYPNTETDAYIAGWCNLSPVDGKPYVYINTKRCYSDTETAITLMHEFMHLSFLLYPTLVWEDAEEDIITDAEKRTYRTIKTIKEFKNDN